MKIIMRGAILAVMAMLLAACDPYHQNEQIGTGVGAVAGGLLGSLVGGGTGQAVAVGVGAVGGALVGNAVGRNMDYDQNCGNGCYSRY